METKKTILILGAGLSGLSAGIHGLQAGYDVTILEKEKYAGGQCTTWYREGDLIDGCIHWVTSYRTGKFHDIYQNMGLYDENIYIKVPYFFVFKDHGKEIKVSRSLSDFRSQLMQYAAFDERLLVDNFILSVQSVIHFPLCKGKPNELMTEDEKNKSKREMIPYLMAYTRLSHYSVQSYADKFHTPMLHNFFLSFMPPYYNMTYMAGVFAKFIGEDADIPNITSKQFAKRALDRYLSLGRKIRYSVNITKININNETKAVTSFEDDKGEKYIADTYLSTMSLPVFYEKILPEEYQNPDVMKIVKDKQWPCLSSFFCAFRLDKGYTGSIPHSASYQTKDPLVIATSSANHVLVQGYPYWKNQDGSITLTTMFDQNEEDFHYWQKAKEDGTYKAKKEEAAEKVKAVLLDQEPDYKDHLSLIDVATPLTVYRYTNSYCGAFLSNLETPKTHRPELPYKEKSLTNLYYAGQFLKPLGGIPTACETGAYAIMWIKHDDEAK